MKYTPRQPDSNVNVTPTSPLKEFFVLLGGLLAIVIGIYFILGFAVDFLVPHLSTDFENKMAGLFIPSIESKKTDSERARYVQSLLDNLQDRCAGLPYNFKVHVVDSKTINALAMPGGHIILFTGLLEKVTSENELAFVIAHELGHYAHRDHLRGLGRALVFMAMSALIFGPDSSIGKMLAKVLNITEMSFSRMQEIQADEFGLITLNCTYGHAAGATDFFEKIPKEQDPGKFGHYFASHPENRRRISRIKSIIQSENMKKMEKKSIPEFNT